MHRPPFQGNDYSGSNFQQGAQNCRPPNRSFCPSRPPGQTRPNMIWNIFPACNGPLSTSNGGSDWIQNGHQPNFHNGPRYNFQNGPRHNFQYGPRMQGGPRLNSIRTSDWQNENPVQWQNRNSGSHGNENPAQWQNRNSGSHGNENPSQWQNRNSGSHGNENPAQWQNRNSGSHGNENECNKWNGPGGWQNENKQNGQCQSQSLNQNFGQRRWGYKNQRNNSNMNFSQQRPHNNKNKNKNKNKVNKRDLAENNQFYCDVCDRGFKTEEKYQEHINGHEKCSVEGCTYLAAPKLVQLHYRLQHSTGLAKKIWMLESKEDIEKWRNERKRNYPTAGNIEKKKKLKEERKSRGEVLETKEFGKFRKRQQGRQRNNNNNDTNNDEDDGRDGKHKGKRNRRKRKNNRRGNKNEDHEISPAKKIKMNEVNSNTTLDCNNIEENRNKGQTEVKVNGSSVDPLSYVLEDDMSDEEPEEIKNKAPPVDSSEASPSETSLIGGLGSIQKMYGSDSESDNEIKPDEKKDSTSKTSENVSPDKKVNKVQPLKAKPKPKRKTDLFYRRRRMTLLEKLLASEIRQERNQILQCVHYIVKNKFFGVGEEKVSNFPHVEKTDTAEKSDSCQK